MKFVIKEVNHNNTHFKNLCVRLDEFQNKLIPKRIDLGFTALNGLEKLQKILLVYHNNKAIACAAIKPVDEITAEIARVYTDEKYRGKGLAKLLINKLTEFAKDLGYKKLLLDTWKDSISAIFLYNKLGFVEIPMFNINTLKNSFSINDEEKLNQIQELLIFMKKDI